MKGGIDFLKFGNKGGDEIFSRKGGDCLQGGGGSKFCQKVRYVTVERSLSFSPLKRIAPKKIINAFLKIHFGDAFLKLC